MDTSKRAVCCICSKKRYQSEMWPVRWIYRPMPWKETTQLTWTCKGECEVKFQEALSDLVGHLQGEVKSLKEYFETHNVDKYLNPP